MIVKVSAERDKELVHVIIANTVEAEEVEEDGK